MTVKVIYPRSTFDVRAARKLQLDTEESVAQLSWAGASNERATNLSNAAKALKDRGAKRILACATHPVLSGPAYQRINDSPIEQVIVTDSIPLRGDAATQGKIQQVTVARMIAEAIKRIHNSDSVSSLFI